MAPFLSGIREHSITDPGRTEKNFLQSRQRNGSGLRFAFSMVFALLRDTGMRDPASLRDDRAPLAIVA